MTQRSSAPPSLPPLRQRPTRPPEEVSPAEWFRQGDYASAARRGGEQEWQTYAALGLLGKTREALDGLDRFGHSEARFYEAVARWIGGAEDAVPPLLERIDTPHARNLLALARKPQIEVLAQWPWARDGCSALLTGAAADARFRVTNIGFQPEDLPNRPCADVRDFYDPRRLPDFYTCAMVEWQVVPPNLPDLPCPVFGQTGDYDLHIQTVHPWLGLFDALVVTDPSEWGEVRRVAGVPVCTFPKTFGVPNGLPPLPAAGQREIDVYLSGTLLHPYHPDKARLLHQIFSLADLRLHLVNGLDDPGRHYDNLAQAKVCVGYVRHATAMPTRGLEALAMGCALVVQEDSVLALYAGPDQGVFPCRLDRDDLPAAIRTIVARWPEFARRAEAGARLLREEFALARVASQYLRFLTFLAARPRPPRRPRDPSRLRQKRPVLHRGWLPGTDLQALARENQQRLQADIARAPASPHALIDLAREAVLADCHRAGTGSNPVPECLASVSGVYRKAMERFPRSLVVRFNYLRVAFHLGTPEIASEVLPLLDETLGRPPQTWQVDAMEDVFPWDFFPAFFNYRGYFDRVTAHLAHSIPVGPDLCRLIRASLYGYRGLYRAREGFCPGSLDDFQAAADLDPDFPSFRLGYAHHLLRRGLPEDCHLAGRLLRELAESSLLFLEAFAALEQVHRRELCQRQERWTDLVRRRDSARAAALRQEIEAMQAQWQRDPLPCRIARARAALQKIEEVPVPPLGTEGSQVEIDRLRDTIRAMQSSKFWKARMAWFRLKACLGLGPNKERCP